MPLALATNNSFSCIGFAFIRSKTKTLIRQQLCTQYAQWGRLWSSERSPPGRGRRRRSGRWESVLSKGHKKGRGIKICVYIPHVFLGSSVTNRTTRPPHKRHALLPILCKTYTRLRFHLHLFLRIGIKNKNLNYIPCEILPWWFDSKTWTTTKRKETKFLALYLSLSVAFSRDLKTRDNTLTTYCFGFIFLVLSGHLIMFQQVGWGWGGVCVWINLLFYCSCRLLQNPSYC